MGKCENCKYFVDTTTSNENGTEYDGYCIIKGDDCFDENCRLMFPFKQIVGAIKKKKHDYYYNHEYDGFLEFFENEENKEKKLKQLIKEYVLHNRDVYFKNSDGEFEPMPEEWLFNSLNYLKSDYEDFTYPHQIKTLKQEWKELIRKTFIQKVANKIKPYVCK